MRGRFGWLGVAIVTLLTCLGGGASRAAREVDPAAFVVLIQPSSMIEGQKRRLAAEGRLSDDNLPVSRPLVGDLVEVMALRNGDSGYEVPQRWMFAKLFRKGEAQVWSAALANTAHFWQPVAVQPGSQGLSVVTAMNDLSPSVLLYDPLWSQPALAGKGEIIVLVTTSQLVVGHTGDAGQVRILRDLVRQGADAPALIAKTLLVRRQGHWVTYP